MTCNKLLHQAQKSPSHSILDVKEIKPNIIVLGYDQIHQEKFIADGCKRINLDVEIVRLQSPVPDLSSSEIEKQYGKDIHGL